MSIDPKTLTLSELAACFDHTILKPGAGRTDIARVCSEARIWKTATVCVHPIWVKDARVELVESGVHVCTVIGFPHGATAYPALVAETVRALEDGATEFDMVIPYGMARSEGWSYVEDNVRAVREAAGSHIVKVILETSELSYQETQDAANAAINGGADYLKTSTGFAADGATEASVRLLAEIAGTRANVKASGGIHSYSETLTMLRAGATRIGTSATVAILEEARQHLKR